MARRSVALCHRGSSSRERIRDGSPLATNRDALLSTSSKVAAAGERSRAISDAVRLVALLDGSSGALPGRAVVRSRCGERERELRAREERDFCEETHEAT